LKVFLSSTFLDSIEEREAVREALHKKQTSTLAMFLHPLFQGKPALPGAFTP